MTTWFPTKISEFKLSLIDIYLGSEGLIALFDSLILNQVLIIDLERQIKNVQFVENSYCDLIFSMRDLFHQKETVQTALIHIVSTLFLQIFFRKQNIASRVFIFWAFVFASQILWILNAPTVIQMIARTNFSTSYRYVALLAIFGRKANFKVVAFGESWVQALLRTFLIFNLIAAKSDSLRRPDIVFLNKVHFDSQWMIILK